MTRLDVGGGHPARPSADGRGRDGQIPLVDQVCGYELSEQGRAPLAQHDAVPPAAEFRSSSSGRTSSPPTAITSMVSGVAAAWILAAPASVVATIGRSSPIGRSRKSGRSFGRLPDRVTTQSRGVGRWDRAVRAVAAAPVGVLGGRYRSARTVAAPTTMTSALARSAASICRSIVDPSPPDRVDSALAPSSEPIMLVSTQVGWWSIVSVRGSASIDRAACSTLTSAGGPGNNRSTSGTLPNAWADNVRPAVADRLWQRRSALSGGALGAASTDFARSPAGRLFTGQSPGGGQRWRTGRGRVRRKITKDLHAARIERMPARATCRMVRNVQVAGRLRAGCAQVVPLFPHRPESLRSLSVAACVVGMVAPSRLAGRQGESWGRVGQCVDAVGAVPRCPSLAMHAAPQRVPTGRARLSAIDLDHRSLTAAPARMGPHHRPEVRTEVTSPARHSPPLEPRS
jgi:hypothetical protein